MPLQGKRKPRKTEATAVAAGAPAAIKRGTTAVDLRIYRAVVNAVMSHRLPPGTHLGEADFCELYQVSRTTVRKALQRLAHDHIIELRPNRGAVIASPTPEEARDIFAARRAIEREIVPLVIRNATPASLKQIRAALHAEDQARRTGDRAAGYAWAASSTSCWRSWPATRCCSATWRNWCRAARSSSRCTRRPAPPCARTTNTRIWPR